MKKIILVCGISLLLLSCLFTGAQLPDYNGVYYIVGRNDYLELEMFKGSPEPEQYSSLVVVNDEPEFLFYEPNIILYLYRLYNLTGENEYSYSYKIEDDTQILVSINAKMEDGIYCFSQGDYSAIPGQTKTWCFSVGNSFGDNINESDDEILTTEDDIESTTGTGWWSYHNSVGPLGIDSYIGMDNLIQTGGIYLFDSKFHQDGSNFFLYIPKFYAFDEEAFYLKDENGYATAYDINNGNKLWESYVEGNVIGIGNEIVFVLSENRIYGLEKSSGEERWKIILDLLFPENDDYKLFPLFTYYDGEYILPLEHDNYTNGRRLRFLHIKEVNGETSLTNFDSEFEGYIEPILYLDNIFVVKDLSYIYGFNVEDGSIEWYWGDDMVDYYSSQADSLGSLKLRGLDKENRILYYSYSEYDAADNYQYLNALDLSTGNHRVWQEPIFLDNGGYIYFREDHLFIKRIYSNVLYIYDRNTSSLLNTIEEERDFTVIPEDNGVILYFSDLEIAKLINPINNEILWEDDEAKYENWLYSLDNIILVKYLDNEKNLKLKAIEVVTGNTLWEIAKDTEYFKEIDYESSVFYGNYLIYQKPWCYQCDSLELLDISTGEILSIALPLKSSITSIEILDNNSWFLFTNNIVLLINR